MRKDIWNNKPKVTPVVLVMGIGCITLLEIFALAQGINGVMLTLTIGTIAAIVGIAIPTPGWMKQ